MQPCSPDSNCETVPASAPESSSWVTVGVVRRAVGLKGWVKVELHTDNPLRFAKGSTLYLEKMNGERESLTVFDSNDSSSPGTVEVLFEGFSDRTRAQAMAQLSLVIPAAERLPPPAGRYYPDEIVGMQVISADGKESGTVISLDIDIPEPYLTVCYNSDAEVLIPFRKVFISSIDVSAGKIILSGSFDQHIPRECK